MRGKIAMPLIAALVLLMTVGGAAAAPPEGLKSYDAGAESAAFQVGLAGQEIAGGVTIAQLSSQGPVSMADGSALLLAGTPVGEAPAAAPDGPAANEDCQVDEELPEPLDTAGLEIGCVTTAAPDTEHSSSLSQSTTIEVLSSQISMQLSDALLGELANALAPVLEQVNGLLGEVCTTLGGILGEQCDVSTAVDELIAQLADPNAAIATITVAPGGSTTSADGTDGVVARALSDGVVIKVLPNALLFGTDDFGEPNAAVTITVAASEAVAVADPETADITTDASVGLIEIEAGDVTQNALGELLGLDDSNALIQTIVSQVNDLVATLADANAGALACGQGNPLEDIVCLNAAAAQTDLDQAAVAALNPNFDFGEGTTGAYATALELRLLSIAQEGGLVSLALSSALAAVNAEAAEPATPTTAPPTTEKELPKTGSGDFAPLVLAAGLGLGAVVIRMRRRALR